MLEKFINYFVERHLLTNLIFVVVVVAGLVSWQGMKKEEMPDVTFDRVSISASYPGATAEEVEYFVTRELEKAVRGIDGVYRVTSTAAQGSTSVSVELEKDYPDKDEAISEIRSAVQDVKLPDDIRDDPTVRVFKTSKMAIIDIALYNNEVHLLDTPQRQELQALAVALEDQLLGLPEVNSVNRSGYFQEEIQIDVDPQKLVRYRIPLSRVIAEVTNGNARQPAGNIEAKNEPKVTIDAQLDTVPKLEKLFVQASFEGQAVSLSDIARVRRGYDSNNSIIKVNGHEAVILNVVKNSSSGILEALDAVVGAVARFRAGPLKEDPRTKVVTLDDESIDVRNRLAIIAGNGTLGFVLILLMLFLFLSKRAGLWVAMGIPFTICFTLAAGKLAGFTINNITLAAVIIVMGMVVDDAIVVAENIARLKAAGEGPREAVVRGTAQVFLPVLASIVTTCVAFVPLYFFSGRFGALNSFIPPVIFLMLGASLFESLVILPGHMYLELPPLRFFARMPAAVANGKAHWFNRFEELYGLFLKEKVLPRKNVILLSFLALLVVTGTLMVFTMKFVMFPNEETREITLSAEAGPEADRYEAAEFARQVEAVMAPYIGKEVVGFRTGIARSRRGGAVEENKFRVLVEIVPKEKRRLSADQLIALWKPKIDAIKDLKKVVVQKSRWGQGSGSAVSVLVQENDDAAREGAANRLAELMKGHPALINVEIERPLQIPEYKIDLQREKVKRLSINPADIASTFRASLEGRVLYELPKGTEEVDVRLSVIEEAKTDIEKILDIPVENKGEYLVPLRDVVIVTPTQTPNSIEREEGKRTTKVFADLKPRSGHTPLDIAADLERDVFPRVLAASPTTHLSFAGEIQDTRESQGDFRNAIILTLLLIFVILAVLFDSFTRPLVIMLAIPFGLVGVVLAFLLHGKVLFGFFAAIGALGLAGVVINDSIIMLSKLDSEFKAGRIADVNGQIAAVAQTRLRAVILTTVTTVAGVLPTAYGFFGYDSMLAEMMLALAWGLVFGTTITLVLVPCLYALMLHLQDKGPSFLLRSARRLLRNKTAVAGFLFFFIMGASAFAQTQGQGEAEKVLPLEEFIRLAAERDTTFEEILIDEMTLKYEKDLQLPARDIVLEVKQQHEFYLSQDRESPATTFSLGKLFPYTGTDVSLEYGVGSSIGSSNRSSGASVTIAQPILENAFGRSTRLLSKIVGLEVDVARYQVTEAYEDYLAAVLGAYHAWYEAHENLKIGESSYRENKKLLDNMEERRQQKIALPIDVNKVKIQVLAKKETLVGLEEAYESSLNVIKQIIRDDGTVRLVPAAPVTAPLDEDFETAFRRFHEESRTFDILKKLEEKSRLQVSRDADDLLPSIELQAGYEVSGAEYDIRRRDDLVFAAVSIAWPFPDQLERAEYEVSKLLADKAKLSTTNTYFRLYAQLVNLYLQIAREEKLKTIAAEKIELASAVLKDETENYSFGKVTLNDYIQAVNTLDTNRFSKVLHDTRHALLLIEWRRLTDRLITKKEIDARRK